MGKSNKNKRAAAGNCALIKGYLPVRVKLPEPPLSANQTDAGGDNDAPNDETFFFVKEHRDGNSSGANNSNSNKGGSSNTLFIANAPIVPGIKTKLILRSLLGRYGEVERVTLVENPRKQEAPMGTSTLETTSSSVEWKPFYPTFHAPIHASEKFAHVVFASSQQMRRTLKALQNVMAGDGGDNKDNDGELPGIQLEKLELQMLREETERSYREETLGIDDDDDAIDINISDSNKPTGIVALAQRYRASLQRLDRDKLLAKCNEVMEDYEDAEEEQRLARDAASNQPDEDGFVTVTSNSVGVEGGKQELEKGGKAKQGRRNNKRNRKKKESIGATELQDFYRFQRKETRKRTLQDLRKQFDEDLRKVKKMKDDRQYKPF